MSLFEGNYDFSVITIADSEISDNAAKNVDKFIDSVKKQDVDFSKIQLIFICSKDNDALKSVKKIKREHPKNVKLIKSNKLDFEAYDAALKKASGKYVVFPELSATYSKKAFSSVKKFFAKNKCAVVKLPVYAKKNDKSVCIDRAYLTKRKIADFEDNYKYATLDLNSCFIVREKLDSVKKADFFLKLQLKDGKIGINSKAKYYRHIKNGTEISKFINLEKLTRFAEDESIKGQAALSAMTKFAYENDIKSVNGENSQKLNEQIEKIYKDREYEYKISVVIPVYKVEKYVEETFASIRRQNIGFFENVQVVFVDDGSPDKSGEICDEIAKKYPENVICIHKENGGVSSARNTGLEYATGKYIGFCDPDDYYKYKATFTKMYDFMEEHGDEVDFVTMPIFFFEAKRGGHPLNNKFANGTRVIDLKYEPQYIQLHLATSFFKSEIIKKYKFNPNLKISEDADVVIRILNEKQKYGVCSDVKYMYRKRDDGSSALQGSMENLSYFTDSMEGYILKLIDDFKDEHNNIPLFLQYIVTYELQWRISYSKDLNTTMLNAKQRVEYMNNIKKALSYIDDAVIAKHLSANFEYKYKMLEIKGTLNPHVEFVWQHPNGYRYAIMSNDLVLGDCSKNPTTIYILDIIDNQLIIEGSTAILHGYFKNPTVLLDIEEKTIEAKRIVSSDYCTYMLGEPIFDNLVFKSAIDLSNINARSRIQLSVKSGDMTINKVNISYSHLCKVNNKFRNQYLFKNGYLLYASNNEITIEPFDENTIPAVEIKLQNEILKNPTEERLELVQYRREYFEQIKKKKKPIWLISDRIVKADDNGKAFFKYVMENHANDVDAYFVLSHESVDYDTLSKIGPVLDYGSHEHLLKMLLADKFISSSADENVLNPFGRNKFFVRGLLDYDFIFLQHGVTKDNISGWLGKFKKDIKGFVTSAKPEYDSIVNGDGYNYDPENIWMTGMPRFDLLYHDEKKYITLMPTWRKYLLTKYDYATGSRESTEKLIKSEYVAFYSSIMSSQKLLDAADRLGYKIKFMPHPGMVPVAHVFKRDPRVELYDFDISYRDVYAESDLIITDYSSAVFDFAYMKKPVMYCQFDSESFFAGDHVYTKGYFDYERDGFGEVEYDLDSTIDRIIEYMENGCKLKDKYRERIDNFFAFNDRGACERIYNKIIEMDK